MPAHDELMRAAANALDTVDLDGYGTRISGKVRDMYHLDDAKRILITTDRISAFDRVLGLIPYKGQVLNQLSVWWFEKTRDIVSNHFVSAPDPNVMIVREAEPLPVEVVVRGYITGVTSTSMWTLYENGDRQPYGISLPDGLNKNDALPQPVITPTTKAADGGHDERLTHGELLARGLVEPALWTQVEQVALALFEHGQETAVQNGLILVDTKYEFGLIDGELALIDEVHTPDSSRYWLARTYDQEAKAEPEHFDKEFLRKWYALAGYRGEGDPPPLRPELAAMVAGRYIHLYEQLTGETFEPGEQPVPSRIADNLRAHLST